MIDTYLFTLAAAAAAYAKLLIAGFEFKEPCSSTGDFPFTFKPGLAFPLAATFELELDLLGFALGTCFVGGDFSLCDAVC